MSAHDEAVEAARMALSWVGCPCSSNVGAQFIRAYLAHMAAAGWKLTPREATEGMTTAAHSALYRWREAQGDPQQDPTNPQKHGIRWAAMHDAAPSPEEAP